MGQEVSPGLRDADGNILISVFLDTNYTHHALGLSWTNTAQAGECFNKTLQSKTRNLVLSHQWIWFCCFPTLQHVEQGGTCLPLAKHRFTPPSMELLLERPTPLLCCYKWLSDDRTR